MQNQSTPNAQLHSKRLRVAMTDSERRLWSRLRGGQLGAKFRRQHPIGAFVVDFACLGPTLIVELDGSQHALQQAYDQRREAFLRGRGFSVLRFDTHEPLRNLDGVVAVIVESLAALAGDALTPTLSQGERE